MGGVEDGNGDRPAHLDDTGSQHELGHADIGVTVRHYAKWCGGSEYRDPMNVEPGEVPADPLARLENSHQTPTTVENGDRGSSVTDWDRKAIGRGVVPRVVGPPGFEPDLMGKKVSDFSQLRGRSGAGDKWATNGR